MVAFAPRAGQTRGQNSPRREDRRGRHGRRYDEAAYFVLEGTDALRIGDGTVELGPGGYAFVPRGTPHTYTNRGAGPARLLLLMSPGAIHW